MRYDAASESTDDVPAQWLRALQRSIADHEEAPRAQEPVNPLDAIKMSGATVQSLVTEHLDILLRLGEHDFNLAVRDLTWAALIDDLQAGRAGEMELTGATLFDAQLRGIVLRAAVLEQADLTGADLSGATLTDCKFGGARLSGACLRGAQLRNADFSYADLHGADLRGADLRDAVFLETELRGALLDGAEFDHNGGFSTDGWENADLYTPGASRLYNEALVLGSRDDHSGLWRMSAANERRLKSLGQPFRLSVHLIVIPIAYRLAFELRFDFATAGTYDALYWSTLPYVMVSRLACLTLFNAMRPWSPETHFRDFLETVRAVTASSAALPLILFMLDQLDTFPRSILVLDWIIAVVAIFFSRIASSTIIPGALSHFRRKRAVLLVRTGTGADDMLRETLADPAFDVIGVVDQGHVAAGQEPFGVPVLGPVTNLEHYLTEHDIDCVILAVPNPSRQAMRYITATCLANNRQIKVIEGRGADRVKKSKIRDVRVEDLVQGGATDHTFSYATHPWSGQVLMMTAARESVGTAMALEAARLGIGTLIVVHHVDYIVRAITETVTKHFPELGIVPVVADVADVGRMGSICAKYRPNIVLHMAEYDDLSIMEANWTEAVRKNVLGTLHVAESAMRNGASSFVLVSNQQAVNPGSVTGATKRLAEQIVLGWPGFIGLPTSRAVIRCAELLDDQHGRLATARRQLRNGGAISVTHPEATSHFMTLQQTVTLIVNTAALSNVTGKVVAPEAVEPVRIIELVEDLIQLASLEPYTDVPIVFTGLLPGEALHEELVDPSEAAVTVATGGVRVLDPGYLRTLHRSEVDALISACVAGDEHGLLAALRVLVPELAEVQERARTAAPVTGDAIPEVPSASTRNG